MRPWSYSRKSTYDDCPRQYQYHYVENLPGFRPSSPAANRGSDLHDKAEKYLLGELKIYPPEFQKVSAHTMALKAKKAQPEVKIAVKEDWTPCNYGDKDAYFRAIIDVLYEDQNVVHVQDWKTGQVYDDHKVQIETYVAVAAAHHPDAEEYHGRLIYIDQGIVTKPAITPANRVKPIRIMLDAGLKQAEEDKIYPMRAGPHCKWCDYSSRHGGPCPH